MDKKVQEQSTTAHTGAKEKKNRHILCIIAWILVVLLILSNLWILYLWQNVTRENNDLRAAQTNLQNENTDLQKKNKDLTKQLSDAKSSAAKEPECNDTVSDFLRENIKAALDSQNTAVFSTYTTNPVKFVIAASEFGASITPDEAALELNYTHTATGPWDFNLPAATLSAYAASSSYGQYFGDGMFVGRAASGMVLSFDFDCSGKVKQIFVAADESLITP